MYVRTIMYQDHRLVVVSVQKIDTAQRSQAPFFLGNAICHENCSGFREAGLDGLYVVCEADAGCFLLAEAMCIRREMQAVYRDLRMAFPFRMFRLVTIVIPPV